MALPSALAAARLPRHARPVLAGVAGVAILLLATATHLRNALSADWPACIDWSSFTGSACARSHGITP